MFEEHLQGEEEQFVIPPHPKYEFKLTSQQKINCQTLVIALYGPASLFAQSLIESKSPDARVNFVKAKQTSLADIYFNQKTNTAFMVFNGETQKMKEVYFSQFIQSNFTFNRVIILTHEYINNLENKCPVSLQVIFFIMKHIKTSAWTQTVGCNKYPEGLMGLAADVLVWAEISRVPACCYVGLLNDYQLSRQTIKEVYGSLVGKQGFQELTDIGQKIKKFNMKKYSNNLYL